MQTLPGNDVEVLKQPTLSKYYLLFTGVYEALFFLVFTRYFRCTLKITIKSLLIIFILSFCNLIFQITNHLKNVKVMLIFMFFFSINLSVSHWRNIKVKLYSCSCYSLPFRLFIKFVLKKIMSLRTCKKKTQAH